MKMALHPYWGPFVALLGLLALTVTCACLPLGAINFPLSLTIGAAKALIVACFFMDLRKENALIRIVSCVGLIWLTIFLLLILTDYLSRYPGTLLEF